MELGLLPSPPHIFKTNDLVRIIYEGRSFEGVVSLASENGVSLALEFTEPPGRLLVLYELGAFSDVFDEKLVVVLPRTTDSSSTGCYLRVGPL